MKKRDRKELGRYCRALCDALELRDGTVTIEHKPVDEGSDGERIIADVQSVSGRKLAYVRVCPNFRDRPREEIRHVLVHELVHVHLVALQAQCENDLSDLVGKPSDTVFFRSFRRNLEYAVDAIAAALSKHQPLIEWPD